MSDLVILTIILFLGIVPFTLFLMKYIIKSKLLLKMGVLIVFFSATIALLALIISHKGLNNLIWAIPLGFLLLSVLMYLLVITIQKPVGKVVNRIGKMAEGDLNFDVEKELLKRNDEIGLIAQSLNILLNVQQNIVNGIYAEANKINEISTQLNKNSENLSQYASEQASSVEEISASMEQMLANINQNSDNAKNTETISDQLANNIAIVNKAVTSAVNTVKSVTDKVTVINEFATKTNILAINAAIEAARAGQQGRGFAVVASEVRKLAENSQTAASDIDSLAGASVKTFDRSVKLLNQLIPEIQKTSGLVKEISTASMEQRSGAEQVNNAIQQLNVVTQQNANAAERILIDSVEFINLADKLRNKIAYFDIKTNQ